MTVPEKTTYAIEPSGNRWVVVAIQGTTRVPLFPSYATGVEAEAKRSRLLQRRALILQGAAHRRKGAA